MFFDRFNLFPWLIMIVSIFYMITGHLCFLFYEYLCFCILLLLLVFVLMNLRSSLNIFDTKTLLMYRCLQRRLPAVSPILAGTHYFHQELESTSLPLGSEHVFLWWQEWSSSDVMWPQSLGLLEAFDASTSPSWKPAPMWKILANLLKRGALWRERGPTR